jgi:hypothetical protein
VARLREEGRNFLDLFVAQERVVIDWNRQNRRGDRLVALYPAEGTLWTDHPLALLELGAARGRADCHRQSATAPIRRSPSLSGKSRRRSSSCLQPATAPPT